jgi:hypothetical protein
MSMSERAPQRLSETLTLEELEQRLRHLLPLASGKRLEFWVARSPVT